jgi:hypothetical protein
MADFYLQISEGIGLVTVHNMQKALRFFCMFSCTFLLYA